ncbi:LOW QUALITY PROTEIN: hypothetical protein Cgig2_017861 [Carnegiea gigantea]|uniref:Uncharacterized protein n=1 Tax=Carnegiea gigantea TaxID=171969 RepID=A0A9Q1QT89_9CARY|nr:LOW QUALITY PROTEIN: hypothetical protein Cgig2_017861 [Carnegiea gigantea]
MALYVLENFKWYYKEVVFPPRPLPCDCEELCPDFNLAVTKEYAQIYELPELPQVVFRAILLNDAIKLCWTDDVVMESVLMELQWNAFQVWTGRNRGRTMEACRQQETSSDSERAREREKALLAPFIMAFPLHHDTGEMANFMRESFRWHWRSAMHLPRPLPDDYRDLCPGFTLSDAERTTLDFELPEMVQATFYAMLLNNAVELGIVSGTMAVDLKLTLEGLRWACFESWLSHNKCGATSSVNPTGRSPRASGRTGRELKRTEVNERGEKRMTSFPTFLDTTQATEYVRDNFRWSLRESSALRPKLLPLNFHGLYPNFNLLMAMQLAHTAHIRWCR